MIVNDDDDDDDDDKGPACNTVDIAASGQASQQATMGQPGQPEVARAIKAGQQDTQTWLTMAVGEQQPSLQVGTNERARDVN